MFCHFRASVNNICLNVTRETVVFRSPSAGTGAGEDGALFSGTGMLDRPTGVTGREAASHAGSSSIGSDGEGPAENVGEAIV